MIKRFENNPNKDMIKAPTEPVIYKNGIHPPYGHFVFNNPLPVMNPPVPINQPVQNMPNMSNVHDQNIPGRIQMIPVGPSPQMLVPVITEPQIVPPNVSGLPKKYFIPFSLGFQAFFLFFVLIHLKVGKHLFKGNFERISDIMKQRRKSPVLKEEARCPVLSALLRFIWCKIQKAAVEFAEYLSVFCISLVYSKSESEYIY